MDRETAEYVNASINALGEHFSNEINKNRGMLEELLSPQKRRNSELDVLEQKITDATYGHASNLVENINIYKEKIHGEPRRTPVTDVYVAGRLVSNEDIFSVLTDTGIGAFAFGCISGYMDSKPDVSPLYLNSTLMKTIKEIDYSPVNSDREMISEDRNSVISYEADFTGLRDHTPEAYVTPDMDGNLNTNDDLGNASVNFSYEIGTENTEDEE